MRFRFILVILSLSCVVGCAAIQNSCKHVHSGFTGLNRHVTLFSNDGKIIREWDITAQIEDNGGTVYFIDHNGKAVTISGTILIEEK